MRIVFVLVPVCLIVALSRCSPETVYERTLSARLAQINSLTWFENTIVVVPVDSLFDNDILFPYWNSVDTFYEEDYVRYKNCLYRAKSTTNNDRPDRSKNTWALLRGPHPFLFLRDSAKTGDLQRLVHNEQLFVRLYSFAALSYRRSNGLFDIIKSSLSDTTMIQVETIDVGYETQASDLMIEWEVGNLTTAQRNELKLKIRQEYPHLERALSTLSNQ